MFTEQDRLICDGMEIKNLRGEKIHLRGTNFGGWLMREGWLDTGAFTIPVKSEQVVLGKDSIIFDFGMKKRWNRVEGLEDLGAVFCSDDGTNWRCEWEGRISGLEKLPYEENRPVPYDIQGQTYNQGVFYSNDRLCIPEVRSRYCKITGKFNHDKVSILRFGDVDEYVSRQILQSRFGRTGMEELLREYQSAYITEKDLDYVKGLGFNFIRVPIYWQELMDEDGKIKGNAWEELDWIIKCSTEKEIYLMLDYHGAPGGNTSGSITAGQLDSNELWNNTEYQKMSCSIWEAIAERYGGEPAVAAYDLLNEPATAWYQELQGALTEEKETGEVHLADFVRMPICSLYERLYQCVRGKGDTHIISVQPFVDWDLLGEPRAHGWEQVLYQVHCYAGNWRSKEGVIEEAGQFLDLLERYCKRWKVPVLAGEFCFWEFEEAWRIWLNGLDQKGIHWSSWNYKNVDPNPLDNWALYYNFNGRFADLVTESFEDIREKFRNYATYNYSLNDKLERILSNHL